jgi:predicted secreted protein
MLDYQNSGYKILGIIVMNDSPTCGVTKTGDLFSSISEGQKDGLKLEDLEYPRLEKVGGLLKKVLVEGQGTFIHEIVEVMKRKKIDTKIIGFDPWCDVNEETERIMTLLFPE